ncbi:hypothetical protein FHS29_001899 [Saccharothrix tamanrassetensis]|uniref:NACHT domain-containing protein n=1 Tax=Saccharothrix tamanrassetensis TaxID=1051531 RepID=A0A841CGL6_9PSEU|nr:hypothetical protein [Saccharothrix tamanrassetensis]MBB5955318.1 hypothetical protein [Saccharothrix tamanrassetensis]
MNRRWWLATGLVLLAAALGWWVVQVTLLDPGDDRANASGYGQFVLAAVGLPISVVALWRTFVPAGAPDLDGLADLLARAVRNQAEATAVERGLVQPAPLPVNWRRATEQVAGPLAAATVTRDGRAWFDPLPGLSRVTAGRLRGGTRKALHAVYGGLPSGRLLIIGGPGAGKSSAAVLLQLDALRYRDQASAEDRGQIPVPVMSTLHGWNPATTSVQDWLVGKLAELPLLRSESGAGHARALLAGGRVAVFLDGLDEIPEPLRPAALRALSEQATFRLVVLTRVDELADAARQHTLTGAVALKLDPLTPAAVAEYLLRPLTEPAPPAWQAVTRALVAGGPLSRALTNPLWVSLVHDIYPPTGEVDELLDTERFPTAEAITDHLLDHVVTAAYTPRPGRPEPRYTADEARRALARVAENLNREGSRDLAWWRLGTQVPRLPRMLLTTIAAAGAGAPAFWIADRFSLTERVVGTALFGLAFGIAAPFYGPEAPTRFTLSAKHLLHPRLGRAEWAGVVGFGVAGGVVIGSASGPALGVAFGALCAVGLTALFGFIGGMKQTEADLGSADPVRIWRRERSAAFGMGVGAGLVIWVLTVSLPGLVGAIAFGLGAAFAASATTHAAVAQAYLAVRYGTPIRLVRFLEDARSRHLLRTVGPIYQFRHATLQDRLASSPPAGRGSSASA